MQMTFQAAAPERAEFTMTLTMRLEDWEKLSKLMDRSEWPAWKMANGIKDMVRTARQTWDQKLEPFASDAPGLP